MKLFERIFLIFIIIILVNNLNASDKALVNTVNSKNAKLYSTNFADVKWTNGFWSDWYGVCEKSMVPLMMGNYMDKEISHAFENFLIAAGMHEGKHVGPPFHDGDFYKIFEAMIAVNAIIKDDRIDRQIDSIISVIALTQRKDGYIHSPVVIEQKNQEVVKTEFAERLDFETYNMGHLMTAACLHYRTTGKKNLLNIAVKATDFLYNFYKLNADELAKNAICPSHYMGVTEMYRTTHDLRYLELAKALIDIRSKVTNGTDHNQDRIPFRKQTTAIGHAVRANYLYAGATDVFLETGDDSLYSALDAIWQDLIERKIYITGACGALYDGVSPDGTSYKPSYIQQVHQAYGREYQLPNLTAHNESCANIGNILWNWRMLLATGDAQYTEIMETVLYNSLLAGVSLDGKGYFYTNPLCVSEDISYNLRWSKEREEYISYCNCCPPNTIRTISEIHNYMYSLSDKGLWFNFYGGNQLNSVLKNGSEISIEQKTDYPWNGNIEVIVQECPKKEFSLFFRIPSWSNKAEIKINNKILSEDPVVQSYFEVKRNWKKGDIISLYFPMKPMLIESNPLVEETRNQIAIKRGPIVYCIESADLPEGKSIFDIVVPSNIELKPEMIEIRGQNMTVLKGDAFLSGNGDWKNTLYKEISTSKEIVSMTLIPYYAWGNRGKGNMSVWLPVSY